MTFQDDITRMLAEGHARMLAAANEQLPPGTPDLIVDSALLITDAPHIVVKRSTGYLPVSTELALDAGIITEEQARGQGWTPPPPAPWRWRLRWRWQSWRERAGRKIGGWLAGVDLTERDDY